MQFSSATYSITEAGGNAVLTVNLIPNGDASKATSVNYAATPITAFSGFNFLSGHRHSHLCAGGDT